MLAPMAGDTAFRSDATFDQAGFRRWLKGLPAADCNRYELLDGRIAMTPPAGWPHASLATTLVVALATDVRRRRLGTVLDSSAGYDLPSGDTVEPDLSFISNHRMAVGPAPVPGRFLRIVPDLVVEILSPATARRDRTEKKAIYERNGVDEYWLVDPSRHAVTLFHLVGDRYGPARPISRGRVHSRVLPALRVTVRDVFDLGA